MWVSESPNLLNDLAKDIRNPKEFLRCVMVLQNQTLEQVWSDAGITREHYYVLLYDLKNGKRLTPETCTKIARALHISPRILYKVITDWEMCNYLKSINYD